MKKMVVGIVATLSLFTFGKVADVQQARPSVRAVRNSRTGVMPSGAQEYLPRAAKQMRKDSSQGDRHTLFMFGIWTPVQVPGAHFDVDGLRLGLYGTCHDLFGIDFGVAGVVENRVMGLRVNVANVSLGDGLGLDIAVANLVAEDYKGIQIAGFNATETGHLAQIGLINHAVDVRGFQIGIVNYADLLKGIQIGLVNVISGSNVPFMPILNCYW